MRLFVFAKRCAKEILRDPLNLVFGLGFPLVLMGLLYAIQANVPTDLFTITRLAPGLAVFGLSFMALFAATLIARDRESAFLQRLYTTPLRPVEFILGYLLPMLPIALAQSLVTYLAAVLLGLPLTGQVLLAVVLQLPMSLLYLALGLLCGSVCNVKQVGGLCGALLTNLSAWLSGVWFEVELVGGGFATVARALPFLHAVELERAVIAGAWSQVGGHLLVILGYALLMLGLSVLLFLRQMRRA